jgi:hypothetical protein
MKSLLSKIEIVADNSYAKAQKPQRIVFKLKYLMNTLLYNAKAELPKTCGALNVRIKN